MRAGSLFQILRLQFDNCLDHLKIRCVSSSPEWEEEDVRGKVVIVTGANSGLGKCTSMEMARRGAIVIMACRDIAAGEEARKDILQSGSSGTGRIYVYKLDLSDLRSIRGFSDEVTRHYPVIDVLVNNAGVLVNSPERKFTRDGFEIHMGVNYLGHFLLTNLLLDALRKSSIRRVVTLTSTMCLMANLSLEDLMMEKSSLGARNTLPYCNSKLANALFTKELARRGKSDGIKAYSVCPGLVKTNILREYDASNNIIFRLIRKCVFAFSVPVERCADTTIYCSLAKDVEQESGKYFRLGKCVTGMENILKDDMAKTLWEQSEELVSTPSLAI